MPSSVLQSVLAGNDSRKEFLEVPFNVHALAVSESTLLAGTQLGGTIFRSTNNGTNWTPINMGSGNGAVQCFAISGTNLFAGHYDGRVRRSTNNGLNWPEVGMPGFSLRALAVSGTNLFAGSHSSGVFLSTNNGTSWSPVNTGLTNTYRAPLKIRFVKRGDSFFRRQAKSKAHSRGSVTEIWRRIRRNESRMPSSVLQSVLAENDSRKEFLEVPYIHCLAVSGDNLFAGTYNGGVFLSTNGGASWTEVNTGLTNTNIWALVVSGTHLFAGTADGVFLSTDNGTNWTPVNTGLTSTDVRSLVVKDGYLFAGTVFGVERCRTLLQWSYSRTNIRQAIDWIRSSRIRSAQAPQLPSVFRHVHLYHSGFLTLWEEKFRFSLPSSWRQARTCGDGMPQVWKAAYTSAGFRRAPIARPGNLFCIDRVCP